MENRQVTSHAYMGVRRDNASNYPQTGVRSGAYLAGHHAVGQREGQLAQGVANSRHFLSHRQVGGGTEHYGLQLSLAWLHFQYGDVIVRYNDYNDQNRSDYEYHYSYRSDSDGFQPQYNL